MRIFAAPIMAIIFIGWVLYRAVITKDLKNYKNEVFGGSVFIGLWVIIYVVGVMVNQ